MPTPDLGFEAPTALDAEPQTSICNLGLGSRLTSNLTSQARHRFLDRPRTSASDPQRGLAVDLGARARDLTGA